VGHLHSEGKKDATGIEQIIKANLRPAFKGRLAASVSTQDARNYRAERTANGVKDSTVNKELKHLLAAFNFGKKQTPKTVTDTPYFPMVAVDNIRTGFLEVPEYRRLLEFLPASLKLFLVLAYHGGCRLSELTNLQWSQVRRRLGFIELQKTKNGKDRNFPIYGDMEEWLDKQEQIREAECPACQHVLFWHRVDVDGFVKVEAGSKLNKFSKTWNRARKKAGLPEILVHDMRRSAIRNMVQEAGMTEGQAQTISGHLTRNVFDRYNIVSLKGILESGKKMDAWMKEATTRAEEQERTRPVAVEPEPLTMKQRVRELFYVQEKKVEEIMTTLNIAESTVYYHLSGDKWRKKTPSSALQV
jgi:integrase